MASLTGNTIQSTYDSLLKVTDNDSITGSLKRITDGLGNNTPLYLSNSAVEIVSALNVTGAITGSNLSGTNTGDETKASIETKLGAATSSNSGYLTSTDWSTFNNKIAGTGTLNKLAKFSSSSSIADSTITDTGSAVTIGVATSVTGSLTASSIIKSGGTASQILAADGSVITAGTNITISGGTISSTGGINGSGTAGKVPLFLTSTSLTDSPITIAYDETIGPMTGINGSPNSAPSPVNLYVNGNSYFNGSITSTGNGTFSGNVRALRFWGGAASFTGHSAPLHVYLDSVGANPIARLNNTESTSSTTVTSMWLENYAGYAGQLVYTTHLNGSNLLFNNTYTSGNILFNIANSEKARIQSTGQLKLNGYTSTTSFSGTAAGYLAFDSSGNIITTAIPSAGISGSGITGYLTRWTGSTSLGNSVVYDDGTKVGVGTTTPFYKFDVKSGGTGTNTFSALFYDSSANGNALGISNANGLSSIYSTYVGTGVSSNLAFVTTTSGGSQNEVMRITSGTNVGIGTTNPGVKLQVLQQSIPSNPTLGTGSGAFFISGDTGLYGLYMGINTSTGNSWLQTMRNNSATAYDMLLQPVGGKVGIGTTSPATNLTVVIPNTNNNIAEIFRLTDSVLVDFKIYLNRGTTQNTSTSVVNTYAGNMSFETNNTERMRIVGGNVGIGTTSPNAKFEVAGVSSNTDFRISRTVDPGVYFSVTAPGGSPNASTLGINGTSVMTLNASGYVGIGTTTPSTQLHLNGAADIRMSNSANTSGFDIGLLGGNADANAYIYQRANSNMIFGTNNAERMRITSGGNVGIGTSSPSYKLDTYGQVGITSDSTEQIVIRTLTNTNRQLLIGYNYTPNYAYLQAVEQGIAYRNLILQPNGGNVGIGTSSPGYRLHVVGSTYLNPATDYNVLFQNSGTTLRMNYLNDAGSANVSAAYRATDFAWQKGDGAETMRITSGGNVGIGTTNPTDGKLQVAGNTQLGNTICQTYFGVAAYSQWITSGGAFAMGLDGAAGTTERMRITSGGNVGIGTSAPQKPLEVISNGNDFVSVGVNTISPGQFAGIHFGYRESNSSYRKSAIVFERTDLTASDAQGKIHILNGPQGSAGSATLSDAKLTIAENGNVGIGTTTPSSKLEVGNGSILVNTNGTITTNCTASLRARTGTSTDRVIEGYSISYSALFYVQNSGNYFFAGSNLSDLRAKKDINYFNDSILDKVMKLKPASFKYTQNDENTKGGFIAQDVKEVFPDLVTKTTSEEELMGVDYYGMIAVLTKAIQEQQAQIEELKARLN